jgi:hypothetical protein
VAEQARQGDGSRAHADDVGIGAAADLAGDLDGLLARGDVRVEIPVALCGGGVAPADREVGHPGADHVLDQASTGRDVGDVELVDLRRDGDEWPSEGLLHGGRVLDELEHLAAVHDLARGDRDVAADGERAGVDRRRHAAVAAHVMGHVAQAGDHAATPGLDRLGQRAGVAEQGVGRRQSLGEQRDSEAGPLAALQVEFDVVDDLEDRAGLDQVGLQHAPVDRVVAPSGVGEALVAGVGTDIAASDEHLEQLAQAAERGCRHDAGLDGHTLQQSSQRGGHLAAIQADKGVGAQHDGIRRIEPAGGAGGRVGRGSGGRHRGVSCRRARVRPIAETWTHFAIVSSERNSGGVLCRAPTRLSRIVRPAQMATAGWVSAAMGDGEPRS